MTDLMTISREIVTLAGRLAALASSPDDAAAYRDCQASLAAQSRRLNAFADASLVSGADTAVLRDGVAASRAATAVAIAARMAGDLTAMIGAPSGDTTTADRARSIVASYAYLQTLAGANAVAARAAPVAAGGAPQPVPDAESMPVPEGGRAGATPEASDLRVLRSVARTHREHARFHAAYKMAAAVELAREANKIKVIADVWLAGGGPAPIPGVDYSDPRYRAAPCSDLNALPALSQIGILFLEGSGEPPEIATLKARLAAVADEIGEMGAFLSRAMDAAWTREAVLLTPDFIDAAWERLLVVIGNWRASYELVLAGVLLRNALDRLAGIDFTPAAIRADIVASGHALRAAGWTIDMAAQCCSRAAISLSDNDWRYTDYGEFLDARFPDAVG